MQFCHTCQHCNTHKQRAPCTCWDNINQCELRPHLCFSTKCKAPLWCRARLCFNAVFQNKCLLPQIQLQLVKLELRLRPPSMGRHDLCERAEGHSGTKTHFITWESNFPALCKKVRQISCSPRISHELFSKHSNTPQPTSPAFTRQCWISAETAGRVRM